ncbi:hypothetical protein HPP92_018659 [Vanilla planifolia]|uniref:Metallo-beta-lactamase domain-containing protein n=1 Tax=Vanilla planifolia TaxID=51239 RepID=A0A835UL03_VANPL|nr:hypothetical protein HPP92_018659 [Vanilla planifolia]
MLCYDWLAVGGMETDVNAFQNGIGFEEFVGSGNGGSSLILLGTGCSSAVPNARCLINPTDPPCQVCSLSLSVPPEKNPNYRCNTSLLIDHLDGNGIHYYILIDVGKTFREQVLRWFTHHKIPRVDSIILTHEHADAVLGLDDIRAVQPHSPTNDIEPTPVYLTQYAMDRSSRRDRWLQCVRQPCSVEDLSAQQTSSMQRRKSGRHDQGGMQMVENQ